MNNIKRLLRFAVCFSFVLIFTASCTIAPQTTDGNITPTEQVSSVPSETPTENISDDTSTNTREISAGASVNNEFTEVASYSYDMDNDGADENIVLTINAERNQNGEFVLNDGQNWQLYIKDNDNCYMLIDRYVQLGEIRFEVMNYYDGNTAVPTVVATTDTGAMLRLTAYTFDTEKNCYVERELYNSSNDSANGINKLYSSTSEVK